MRRGYIYVALAIVLFSTVEVISKYLQEGSAGAPVGKVEIALFRFIFGALLVLAVALARGQWRTMLTVLKEHPVALLALGAVGVFLTFYALHWALEISDAGVTAVIFSLNPIFTAGIAALVLKERTNLAVWGGLALGMAGAVISITRLNFSNLAGRADVRGGLLALAAALCWSIYTVYGKRYSERYGAVAVSCITMTVGALLFLVASLASGSLGSMTSYSLKSWALLAYLGVAAVGIGYLLYFEGLRRVTASRGTALFYLKPVLATVFAYLILGEPLSATVLSAAGLAAIGILAVTLERAEKGEPARDWTED